MQLYQVHPELRADVGSRQNISLPHTLDQKGGCRSRCEEKSLLDIFTTNLGGRSSYLFGRAIQINYSEKSPFEKTKLKRSLKRFLRVVSCDRGAILIRRTDPDNRHERRRTRSSVAGPMLSVIPSPDDRPAIRLTQWQLPLQSAHRHRVTEAGGVLGRHRDLRDLRWRAGKSAAPQARSLPVRP